MEASRTITIDPWPIGTVPKVQQYSEFKKRNKKMIGIIKRGVTYPIVNDDFGEEDFQISYSGRHQQAYFLKFHPHGNQFGYFHGGKCFYHSVLPGGYSKEMLARVRYEMHQCFVNDVMSPRLVDVSDLASVDASSPVHHDASDVKASSPPVNLAPVADHPSSIHANPAQFQSAPAVHSQPSSSLTPPPVATNPIISTDTKSRTSPLNMGAEMGPIGPPRDDELGSDAEAESHPHIDDGDIDWEQEEDVREDEKQDDADIQWRMYDDLDSSSATFLIGDGYVAARAGMVMGMQYCGC